MSTLTLYKISEEQSRLNAMLEESMGEVTPEIEEALAITRENFLIKAENYAAAAFLYKSLEDRAADEIRRLQGVKAAAQKIQDNLKSRLADAMRLFDENHVEVGTYKLSFRKSTSVNITDERAIPGEFIEIKTSIKKAEVKAALAGGIEVPGAELIENQNLQIR